MKLPTLHFVAIGTACALALTACGGSSEPSAPAGPASTADTGTASEVTPPDAATLAAANKEGTLTLYTNADDQLMKPIAAAFRAKYPGIAVKTLEMDDTQAFQRYSTEKATGAKTADVLIASNAVGLLDFVRRGNILDHTDPNVAHLPEYARLAPGVVAMSEDPVLSVFNKALLPEGRQPTDMASLAALASSMKGKVATTDIGNAIQFSAMAGYVGKKGESGWQNIEKIGPNAGVESNTGNLMQKLVQGQYAATYFVPGTVRAQITGDAAKVLGYSYLKDGTPLIPRGIGVTAGASSPNAGKVFMNFVLSVEGQEAACKGGFTPYRAGVTCPYGLAAIQEAVGADNMILGGYPADLATRQPAIVSRWKTAFKR